MWLSGVRGEARRYGWLLSSTALSLALVGCSGNYYYGDVGLAIPPLSFLRVSLREQLADSGDGGDSNVSETLLENGGVEVGDFSAAGLAPGSSVSYTILPLGDGALFSVSPEGILSFRNELDRDHEKRASYSLSYRVASDGEAKDYAVVLMLSNVDEAPEFLDKVGSVSVTENLAIGDEIASFEARDPEGDVVVYSLDRGGGEFTLSAGGSLKFVSSPDFESKSVYDVEVTALAMGLSSKKTLRVVVEDEDEQPVFMGALAEVLWTENSEAVSVVVDIDAEDPEMLGVMYRKSGGADEALFLVDADDGEVRFVASPDFEMSQAMGVANEYELDVEASDGTSAPVVHMLKVKVENEDEQPLFMVAPAEVMWDENELSGDVVVKIEAEDPEMSVVMYRKSGGEDEALFSVDETTGEVRFVASPDFEVMADADNNNEYELEVEARDGTTTPVVHMLKVKVADVNESPSFDGLVTVIDFDEEQDASVVVVTLMGKDEDGGSVLMFSNSGGADGSFFMVDADSGEVRFVSSPDFEAMADANIDDVYEVEVSVTDGVLSVSETLSINLQNVNEALEFDPFVSSGVMYDGVTMTVEVNENETMVGTLSATDTDGKVVTYMLEGVDVGLFSISTTGEITFVGASDFEMPMSDAGTNTYMLTVRAVTVDDDIMEDFTVEVLNVNEAPTLTGGTTNITWKKGELPTFIDVTSLFMDEDAGDMLTYMTTTLPSWLELDDGMLQVVTGRVVGLENVGGVNDVGAEDVSVTVTATDEMGLSEMETLTLMLEASDNLGLPVFTAGTPMTWNVLEGVPSGRSVYQFFASDSDPLDHVTYSLDLNGEPAGYFNLTAGGLLRFGDTMPASSVALDFENLMDMGGDGTFDLKIVAMSSATDTVSFDFAVVLGNVNEEVTFDGTLPTSLNINATTVDIATYRLADEDAGSMFSFELYGRDSDVFEIDSTTGVVMLSTLWSYADAYDRSATHALTVVGISEDIGLGEQRVSSDLTLTLTGTPLFSMGVTGYPDVEFVRGENERWYVPLDWVQDPEGGALTYTVSAVGASWLRFFSGGYLASSFSSGGIMETAVPSDTRTAAAVSYTVNVTASDDEGESFTSSFMLSFRGTGTSAPDFGATMYDFSVGGGMADALVGTVSASDTDGDTILYSITTATDASNFYFRGADLYTREALVAGTNYNFTARAQGGGNNDTAMVEVMVTGTGGTGVVFNTTWDSDEYVSENDVSMYDFSAVLGVGETVAYTLGGLDSGGFEIDALGQLMFMGSPDFEDAMDSDNDNVYEVEVTAMVTATAGVMTSSQSVSFHVLDLWDEVPVVSVGVPDQTVMEGGQFDFMLPAVTFTDADNGDVLTYMYSWVGALWLVDVGGGRLYSPYVPEGSTDVDVTVMATDNRGNTVADTFTLMVTTTSFDEDEVVGLMLFLDEDFI